MTPGDERRFFVGDARRFSTSGNFPGEVLTDGKKKRHPGARVKHRVKENRWKKYATFGLILPVETVISDPREFEVRSRREWQGRL